VLDDADAAEFAAAAKKYVAANTTSQSAAHRKLEELGFIDGAGKLTKNYR
jgi:Fe2+ transport system protein FeoA